MCDPANPRGLGVQFFHDEEGGLVVAELELDDAFSGAPRYVHGGVVLAVLDEAMAWAAIALAGRFALTRATTSSFHRPVEVGRPHRVEGRVEEHGAEEVRARAELLDGRGRRCAESRGRLAVLSPAQAGAAVGKVPREHRRYLGTGGEVVG